MGVAARIFSVREVGVPSSFQSRAAFWRVEKNPGAMALTRMPVLAKWTANHWVKSHHVPGKDLGSQQHACKIEVEHRLYPLPIQRKEGFGLRIQIAGLKVLLVGGGSRVVAACAVDKYITGAEVRQRRLMAGIQSLPVQYVALVGLCRASLSADLLCHSLGVGQGAVEQSHLRTRRGQSLGKFAAEDSARAGNHSNLAG